MASITRPEVAAEVHESLGTLSGSLRTTSSGALTEGDYTRPINRALRDCAYDDISDADTHGKIRAIVAGTCYYALIRLYRTRATEMTSQHGAGASGMHISMDPSTSLGSLRLHVESEFDRYQQALLAIGRHLDVDPETGGTNLAVRIDEDDSLLGVLADDDVAPPWFPETPYDWEAA